MTVCAQLQDLSRRLVARGERGRAVMIMPVRAGAGASWVSARLAANASRESGRPVWLYDLDFAANTQAGRTRLNGAAYDADFGTEPFWRADPSGSSSPRRPPIGTGSGPLARWRLSTSRPAARPPPPSPAISTA